MERAILKRSIEFIRGGTEAMSRYLSTAAVLFVFCATGALAQNEECGEDGVGTTADGTPYCKDLAVYISSKPYFGSVRSYTEADLSGANEVPTDIQGMLGTMGITPFSYLRNEVIARRGYKFQDPGLQRLFSLASWYRYDPTFTFADLSSLERKNMNFIKTVEDGSDYRAIAEWLDSPGRGSYGGDSWLYATEGDLARYLGEPLDADRALSHLQTTDARVLRNEIFARHGYIFSDPVMRHIFESTDWYVKRTTDAAQIGAEMNDTEKVNIEILKMVEWARLPHAVKITLPPDTIGVPTVDYGALYVRTIPRGQENYYFSAPSIYSVLAESAKHFDDHKTDVDSLVSKEARNKIENELDPRRKILLFLEEKRYAGYADTVFFNHSDFEPPSYLKQALKEAGINYDSLIRKEIHARKGAIMLDTPVGKLFKQCSWYRPRYYLVPSSPTRFPSSVRFTKAELHNFRTPDMSRLPRRNSLTDWSLVSNNLCNLTGH
ncbi:MAG: YARHG domain-containing protein, partial [Elusimicrobia bacterium]|nr:YARHG domain-containing protein [Elusimicrobiota bacterium]